ncbi:MAG TPA: HAMP domain-containing sensor histidine kinase [Candidatus Limnocylindrales bacterium]
MTVPLEPPRLAQAGTADDEPGLAALRARLAVLEAERRRTFEDAQREADTMFAQYQLSQLLASGDALPRLAEAVLAELSRSAETGAAALWLSAPDASPLRLVSVVRQPAQGAPVDSQAAVPTSFPDVARAAAWAASAGWAGVALEESRDLGDGGFGQRPVGFVALAPGGGDEAAAAASFLARVRHELAIAFRAAQLRATLDHERALLSAILDGARDAILAVDAERHVVRYNLAAVALLGLGDGSPGLACHEYLGCGGRTSVGSPDDVGQAEAVVAHCGPTCPFEEVLTGAPAIGLREQVVVDRLGNQVPVAGSYARMPGPEIGAVAVLRDLRLERAVDELKSSFVAAVSHELRTPLALISGYAQSLLRLDLEPEERRRFVERIDRTADRLTGLVDQLLDTAYLESDRLSVDRRPTTLPAILGPVLDEVAETPGTPPVRLALPADLPPVYVDPVRIGQVLANLLGNARKYGGPSPVVVVRARREDGSIIVTVEDDGPGIDAVDRDHIFDRFYRGRGARASGQAGSGLGLYLCRRLVEAHGGSIWLEQVERGTAVSFSLPLAADRWETAPGAARTAPPDGDATADRSRRAPARGRR